MRKSVFLLLLSLFSCSVAEQPQPSQFQKDASYIVKTDSQKASLLYGLAPILDRVDFNGYSYSLIQPESREDFKKISQLDETLFIEKEIPKELTTETSSESNLFYAHTVTNFYDFKVNGSRYEGEDVFVAILDSGINFEHELFASLATETGYNSIEDSSYIPTGNRDDNGHGSHVAGIIAASKSAETGFEGVAPEVTIIPYKVAGSNGTISNISIARALNHFYDNYADNDNYADKPLIINMSYGSYAPSITELEALTPLIKEGVVIISSAGNNSSNLISYPASYPGVISVMATNREDEKSHFSSWGDTVTVGAPGERIISLSNLSNQGFVIKSGTSMSTPYITGIAAIIGDILSTERRIGEFQSLLPEIIKQGVNSLGEAGPTPFYGYGRIDGAALAAIDYGTIESNKWSLTVEIRENQQPLKGFTTQLNEKSGRSLFTITDSLGIALFPLLDESQTYELYVSQGGAGYENRNISFNSFTDNRVTIEL